MPVKNSVTAQNARRDIFQHLVLVAVKVPITSIYQYKKTTFGTPCGFECTGAVTQLVREAKEGKSELEVPWLDYATIQTG